MSLPLSREDHMESSAHIKMSISESKAHILNFAEILRVKNERGGRLEIKLPAVEGKGYIEAVIGGPNSAPDMANALRKLANQLDRAHQDYHHTGAGVLRQTMDQIRALDGCGHVHLPQTTFRAMANLITAMKSTDDTREASMNLIHHISGTFPEAMARAVASVIQHCLVTEAERRMA